MVPDGAFFGLLGPNGAGKTTLISAVCNLIRVTAGDVRIFGHEHGTHAARALSGWPSRTSTSTASSTSRRRCSTTAATTGWTARGRAGARAR